MAFSPPNSQGQATDPMSDVCTKAAPWAATHFHINHMFFRAACSHILPEPTFIPLLQLPCTFRVLETGHTGSDLSTKVVYYSELHSYPFLPPTKNRLRTPCPASMCDNLPAVYRLPTDEHHSLALRTSSLLVSIGIAGVPWIPEEVKTERL